VSAAASGGWLTVQKIIECFVAMGCDPREVPDQPVEAGDDWHVYYLYNPTNGGFVSLCGFALDEEVAPSTLASWERALGVEIPWGKLNH
jgi:hypothetical protein